MFAFAIPRLMPAIAPVQPICAILLSVSTTVDPFLHPIYLFTMMPRHCLVSPFTFCTTMPHFHSVFFLLSLSSFCGLSVCIEFASVRCSEYLPFQCFHRVFRSCLFLFSLAGFIWHHTYTLTYIYVHLTSFPVLLYHNPYIHIPIFTHEYLVPNSILASSS